MDKNSSSFPIMITQAMIPNGGILPRHLAAATTMKAGDIYFVNSSGIFQRLAPGTVGQKLTILSTGLPGWS